MPRRYCDRGTVVDFDWMLGDHLLGAVTGANNVMVFLVARFASTGSTDLHGPVDDCPDIRHL